MTICIKTYRRVIISNMLSITIPVFARPHAVILLGKYSGDGADRDWSDAATSRQMPAATDAGRSKKWILLDFSAVTLISGLWLQNCCLKALSLWQFFTAASGN